MELVKVRVPAPALVKVPVSLIIPVKLVSVPVAWFIVKPPEPSKILESL